MLLKGSPFPVAISSAGQGDSLLRVPPDQRSGKEDSIWKVGGGLDTCCQQGGNKRSHI